MDGIAGGQDWQGVAVLLQRAELILTWSAPCRLLNIAHVVVVQLEFDDSGLTVLPAYRSLRIQRIAENERHRREVSRLSDEAAKDFCAYFDMPLQSDMAYEYEVKGAENG